MVFLNQQADSLCTNLPNLVRQSSVGEVHITPRQVTFNDGDYIPNEAECFFNDSGDRKQRLEPCADISWTQTPLPPTFPVGRVDVWKVRLDEAGIAGSAATVLSTDEIARANRFSFRKRPASLYEMSFGSSKPPGTLCCNSSDRD